MGLLACWRQAAWAASVAVCIFFGNVKVGDESGRTAENGCCHPPLAETVFVWRVHEVEVGNIAVNPQVAGQLHIEHPLLFDSPDRIRTDIITPALSLSGV